MAVIRPHSPRRKKTARPRLIVLSLFLVVFHFFWFLSSSFFLLAIFRNDSSNSYDSISSRGGKEPPILSALLPQQQQQQPLLRLVGGNQLSLGSEEMERRNLQSTTTTFFSKSSLHARRAAFFANVSLLLTLNTTESCHGKEELLSILYATTYRPKRNHTKLDDKRRKQQARRGSRSASTTKLSLAAGIQKGITPPNNASNVIMSHPSYGDFVKQQEVKRKEVNATTPSISKNDNKVKPLGRSPATPVKKNPLDWKTFLGTASDLVDACPLLPTWQQVTSLYGNEAVVLGMETCEGYRQRIAADKVQPKVRIAGLFNSGTTSLSQAMRLNFPGTDTNRGMHSEGNSVEFDVPWGKHVPPKYKWKNKHPIRNKESPKYVFPVVIVREPYRWMHSMCKEGYDAVWGRETNHCPNILRPVDGWWAADVENNTYPVHVSYQQSRRKINETHASLSDYWSEWIRNYYDSNEPRLLVRHEDLLFHAEDVMLKITECVGLESKLAWPFQYQTRPSKKHGDTGDFFSTLRKYGREIVVNMTRDDIEYVQSWTPSTRQGLDGELMAKFHYHHPIATAQSPNVRVFFK